MPRAHRSSGSSRYWALASAALVSSFSATQVAFGMGGVVRGWGDYASTLPPGQTNLVAIDAAAGHTMVLTAPGKVLVGGWSQYNLEQVPDDLEDVTAISTSEYSCVALRRNGTVAHWGLFSELAPKNLTNAVAISAGMRHSLAARSDGTVVAWGALDDPWGALTVPATLTNAVAVAAGQAFSAAITADGKVVGWGNRWYYGFDAVEASLTNVMALSLGPFGHGLALRANGTVAAFGNNSYGQATVPPGLSNVVAVAAGGEHSLALTESGNVVGWGKDSSGQAQTPSGIIQALAIAAGPNSSAVLTLAPRIAGQLDGQQGVAGDDLVLALAVDCAVAFESYWYQDGALLAGHPEFPLRLENAQPEASGTYSLVVSNRYGWDASWPVYVPVYPSAPHWRVAPEHQAALAGAQARFEAEARGSDPLQYQWFHGGIELVGATNRFLEFNPVADSDAGEYWVEVKNDLGMLRSESVYLATAAPILTRQPADRQVRVGWTEVLSAEVASPLPVAYQWLLDGTPILGAQHPMLTLEGITESRAGSYTVAVSNALGVTTSVPIEVSLLPEFSGWPEPGIVVGWGQSWAGQVESPKDLTNAVAIAAGQTHNLALKADGALVSWGDPYALGLHAIPAAAFDIVDVAAAKDQSVALRRDGAVIRWAVTGGPTLITNVQAAAIAASEYWTLAATREGRVLQYPLPEQVPADLTNIVDVAAGSDFHYALRSDGIVFSWRPSPDPSSLRAEPVPGMVDIIEFDANYWPYVGLRRNGTVVSSESGTLMLPNLVAVEQARDGTLALDRDGQVHAWGIFSGPLQPPRGLVASRISADTAHCVAITSLPFAEVPPASQVRYAGADVELEVSVRSASPLDYLWFHNEQAIDGATNASLLIPDLRPSHAGAYRVRLRNSGGVVITDPADVTVLGAPEILEQPEDRTVGAGESVTFSVGLAANPPASLQWWFQSEAIAGATNIELTIPNAQANAEGNYSVRAVNSFGSVWSGPASLTVTSQPPHILGLDDLAVGEGSAAEFVPVVTGSEPFQFEWWFGGVPMAGASGPVLRIENVQASDAGTYSLRVANSLGEASASVTLATIPQPPRVQLRPVWRLAWEGEEIVLQAEATGTRPMRFEWYQENVLLPQASGSFLLVPVALGPQRYRVRVGNDLGETDSEFVEVFGVPRPVPGLPVTWGPFSVPEETGLLSSVAVGASHWLALTPDGRVVAGGSGSYGQATPPGSLTDVMAISAGREFSLALTADGTVTGWGRNDFGQISIPADLAQVVAVSAGTWHAAALRADGSVVCWGRPQMTNAPAGATNLVAIDAGESHSVALRADGTVVTWGSRWDQLPVPASVTNIVAVQAGTDISIALDAQGQVRLWGVTALPSRPPDLPRPGDIRVAGRVVLEIGTNGVVSVWGASSGFPKVPAFLTNVVQAEIGAIAAIALTAQPRLQTTAWGDIVAALGGPVRVSVTAVGTPSLEYRWFHNGLPLADAGGAELRIDSLTLDQVGAYHVEVANGFGLVRSPAFRIDLPAQPSILAPPVLQRVVMGGDARFAVEATGTEPLQYQWTFNGTNLWRATNAVLSLPMASKADEGQYAVRIWNAFGEVVSPAAALVVFGPANLPAQMHPPRWESGELILDADLQPGCFYRLQSSTDLRNWQREQILFVEETPHRVTIIPGTLPRRFYRLISP